MNQKIEPRNRRNTRKKSDHRFLSYAFVLLSCISSVSWFAAPAAAVGNTWSSLAAPPATIGGANSGRNTAAAGTDTLFQLRGGGTRTVFRYQISTDTWSQVDSTPTAIANGATLVYPGSGDSLFATKGGTTRPFYSYSISRNQWDTMAQFPGNIFDGSAMCVAGADTLFATRGNGTAFFYRYRISGNVWDTMANAPATILNGASLTYPGSGDFIYALGGSSTTFYRYSISANSWSTLTPYPVAVATGSSLIFGPDGFMYGVRGFTGTDFFRYTVTTDSWTRLANSPSAFSDGSGLTYPGTGLFLYAIRGGNTSNFSRYLFQTTPDTPTSLAQTKLDSTLVSVGGFISDSSSIRFAVQANDLSDTCRIQIELRTVSAAFTSPVDVTVDSAIFFQSAFSAVAGGETLNIIADSLASASYHWQVRVVDASGDSTGWVRFGSNTENPPTNPAAADFIIGTVSTGLFPASLRISDSASAIITDTDRNANAGVTETVSVTVTNNRTGESETFQMTEQSANSSRFGGNDTLPLSSNTADNGTNSGRLFVLAGDTVTIRYVDPSIPTDSIASGNITVSHDSVASAGTFPSSIRLAESVSAVIRDTDQNFSGIRVETVSITITNNRTGESESLTISENGANAGYFGGNDSLSLSASAADSLSNSGRLFALTGDTISIRYIDPTDATDSAVSGNITVTTTGVDTPRIRFLTTSPIDTRSNSFAIRISIDSAVRGDSVRLFVNNVNIETQAMTDSAETRTFTINVGTNLNTAVIQITRQSLGDTFTDSISIRFDTVVPSGSVLTITDTLVTTPTFRWTAATDSNAISAYRVILRSLADSSVLMAFDTSGLSATCTTPLAIGLYRADLSCTDALGNTNSNVDSRSFSIVPDTSRVRIQATSPIDTRVTTFALRAAIDSAVAGDTVRLIVNNTVIETQIMTGVNETRTFTVANVIVYNNTVAVQVTRHIGGASFADSILVRLDTAGPLGSVLTISDTIVTTPTFRWTAATDSNGVSAYRVTLRSLADSSVLMAFDTSGLSASCTTPLAVALYRADLACTDAFGNTNSNVDSRSFSILPDTSRVRIQATSPVDTRVTTFALVAAIDSAVVGDTVRLIVNNTVIETQIMTGTNETRTFTVANVIVYNNTVAVQVTRSVGGSSYADTILVRLDTVAPTGSVLSIVDTVVATPTFRWTAATDSNAIAAYRVTLRSLADSSVLMAFDTSGLSATCTTPLAVTLYRADLSCTDALGNTNSNIDSRSFNVYPDTSRDRIQATSPVDTRSTSFVLRAAIDSGVAGDTVRLIVNNVVIETQILAATNETRTFTVANVIVYHNTVAVQITRHTGGASFSDSILVRLDTAGPSGSVLSISDTVVSTPTFRWTAATDSNGVSAYRVTLRSLADSSVLMAFDTSGLSAACTIPLAVASYRADLACTDAFGSTNSNVDSRSFNILPDISRVRIQATSPIDTRVTTFSLRAAIDSGTAGDTVRLIVNNTVIETQIMTGVNETRTFTVANVIVYNNTVAVQITRHVGGASFSDSILVRLDTLAPTGSVLTIGDTAVRLPTIRWTAATDSNGVASYRITVRSLSDSSTLLTYETSGLSATVDSALIIGVYRADLICTDGLGNASGVIDSRSFTIYADTPRLLTLVDSQTFILSPNTFASDSSRFIVRDSNGIGVPNYLVAVPIVARPTGATGDTFVRTATDSNGRCTVILKAGDKTGVYVLKVSVPGISPIYLCYQTNEFDVIANQWNMIALLRAPTSSNVAQALSISPANIFHWDPVAPSSAKNLQYVIPTTLEQGQGYFLYEVTSPRLTVTGMTLKTDTADIALRTGWNQLGSPFAYLTQYNAARIITTGGANLSLAEAEAQGVIVNKVFWYKNNAYQFGPNSTNADPILSPWNGFWIYAAANATLRLSPSFYYSESTTSTLASAQAAGDVTDWRIKVTSSASSGATTVNYLGVSPTATENSDFALDIGNPPPLGNGLASGLGSGAAFAQDLRAPFASANVWLFSVTPSASDTTVGLQFGELSNLPADFVVRLVDLGSNEITDVKASPNYSYASSGATARSFRIVVGTEAAVRTLLGQQLDQNQTFAYPNPGPAADGNVRFKYNVPAGGQLRLRVFDLSGRRVLDRYVDLNTFPTEYAWDCKNDRGIAIGTGAYIYIIDIGNSTGNRRFTDKLAIIR